MSSPIICSKHGPQFLVHTSPMIYELILNGNIKSNIKIFSIKVINVDNEKKWIWYVDETFFKSFIGNGDNNQITLIDRSKKNRKLNDRILICKIRRSMEHVCNKCLKDFIGQDYLN